MTAQYDGWTKLAVGCHWTRGPFTVSTTRMGDGSRSGYLLVKDRQVIGEYLTWAEVARIVAAYEVAQESDPTPVSALMARREADVRAGRLLDEAGQ